MMRLFEFAVNINEIDGSRYDLVYSLLGVVLFFSFGSLEKFFGFVCSSVKTVQVDDEFVDNNNVSKDVPDSTNVELQLLRRRSREDISVTTEKFILLERNQ